MQSTAINRCEIVRKLRNVIDPELGVNIVDLGLIYNIIIEDASVTVEFTTTTRGCPMRRFLTQQVEEALASMAKIKNHKAQLVWEPEWSVDMIKPDVEFFTPPRRSSVTVSSNYRYFMNSRKLTTYILTTVLLLAGIGLLAGLYAGIGRMGLVWGGHHAISPLLHGPLMINGFLGTLISLERAAALENRWAYGAPLSFAVATIFLLFFSITGGQILFIVGSVFLLAIMVHLYLLQAELYHLIMILGAACLLIGNVLLITGDPIFNLVAWWAGFLLLTIFAERLELNRIMRPPRKARILFFTLAILWICGVALTYVNRYAGWGLSSVSLIAQACWLFKYDIARRTIKARKWTRYSAICLLTGYGWLIIAGIFGLWYSLPYAGLPYDAQLHMIFIGFVFSMIFAHASVIIPSLSGKLIPYHSYFYLPLILLESFLLVRVIGDITGFQNLRRIGGHGNAGAILLFMGGVLFQLGKKSLLAGKQAI